MPDIGLIPRIHRKLLKPKEKRKEKNYKWIRELTKQFTKGEIGMVDRHKKDIQHQVIKEIK